MYLLPIKFHLLCPQNSTGKGTSTIHTPVVNSVACVSLIQYGAIYFIFRGNNVYMMAELFCFTIWQGFVLVLYCWFAI